VAIFFSLLSRATLASSFIGIAGGGGIFGVFGMMHMIAASPRILMEQLAVTSEVRDVRFQDKPQFGQHRYGFGVAGNRAALYTLKT